MEEIKAYINSESGNARTFIIQKYIENPALFKNRKKYQAIKLQQNLATKNISIETMTISIKLKAFGMNTPLEAYTRIGSYYKESESQTELLG